MPDIAFIPQPLGGFLDVYDPSPLLYPKGEEAQENDRFISHPSAPPSRTGRGRQGMLICLLAMYVKAPDLYPPGELTGFLQHALTTCPFSSEDRTQPKQAVPHYDWRRIVSLYDDALEALFF